MSGSSVFLFVGVTTLVAAVVTLCAFQITAARMERNRNRRTRTLEGPVPGHRSLSSIGLNTRTDQSTPHSPALHGQRPLIPARTPTGDSQTQGLPKSSTTQSPVPTKENKLNSLQTIRARSAAIRSEGQPSKAGKPKPLAPANAPSVQRSTTHTPPAQEQGGTAPHATTGSEQPENIDRAPSNVGQAEDSSGAATIQKTTTSKRTKRASPQAETSQSDLNQLPIDASANDGGLNILGTLQTSPAGGSPLPSSSQEGGTLDILAGLSEAEAGFPDVTGDLNDIDGGGLPTTRKSPQKSKR